jgi:hypothetical protein
MSHFLARCGVDRYCNELGKFAALFAALAHDVAHPGLSNAFLVKTWHPLAVRYNDRSPLEMMHASVAFEVLREPDCDLLASLPLDDRQLFRKIVISMILATDNAEHDLVLSRLTKLGQALHAAGSPRIKSPPPGVAASLNAAAPPAILAPATESEAKTHRRNLSASSQIMVSDLEQLHVLEAALHAADISSSCKPWATYQQWTERLCVEFRSQGDLEKERGLPVLPFMDRTIKLPISRFQAGFIQTIVYPLYHGLQQVSDLDFQHCLVQLADNLRCWQAASESEAAAQQQQQQQQSKSPTNPALQSASS